MPKGTGKSLMDIRSLARAHTKSAIHTLSKIMTEVSAPAAARVAAAVALLDRGWGKPDSKLYVERRNVTEMSDNDLATIIAEFRSGDGGGSSAGDDPAPDPSTPLH